MGASEIMDRETERLPLWPPSQGREDRARRREWLDRLIEERREQERMMQSAKADIDRINAGKPSGSDWS
jgi:hypothetical protein